MEEYTADMAEALSSVEIATPEEVFEKVLRQHRIDILADELLDKIVKKGPTGVGIYGVEALVDDEGRNLVEELDMNVEGQDVTQEEADRILSLDLQKKMGETYLEKAKRIVQTWRDAQFDKSDDPVAYEVYAVWFTKTLKNWKAMVSTSLNDEIYYEVTYDGEKKQTYLDVYKKWTNVCVPDED